MAVIRVSELSQDEIKKRIDDSHEVIHDWSSLHKRFEVMRDTSWIFRGVSSSSHYPVPSIGREGVYGEYNAEQEDRLFREFKKRAIAILPGGGFDDWHWLAFAQHTGVPTRLLDWSSSPLIALFFALEKEGSQDRALYAMKYSQYIYEVEQHVAGPLARNRVGRFSPPYAFDRIRAQRGLFTIHPDPTKVFYRTSMRTLVIPGRKVSDFRRRLYKYGVDPWLVYPDMHGLGSQLSWQYKNRVGLGRLTV